MGILARISVVIGLGLFCIASPAKSASLFNVVSEGNNLTITTSPSNPVSAGPAVIKSSGFNFTNCTPVANGYCLFPASTTQSYTLGMTGPATQPQLTLYNWGANNKPNACQNLTLGERFAYIVNYM